jgi:hypothetical protein
LWIKEDIMAQSLDLLLHVGHLFSFAGSTLTADDLNPAVKPGTLSFVVDAFGRRVFMYGRTRQAGGQSKGELCARLADVTGTVTAAAGEVNSTSQLAATTVFTAGVEEGKLCIITDDAGGAGAAPEGEVAVITDNTASQLTFDPGYRLTVAPAVSDTFRDYSVWAHDDSADGDLAINIMGIVMADRTAAYYGWTQIYGLNPGALYTTTAVTPAGEILVADAAALNDRGTDAAQLWVGYAPEALQADFVSPFRTLAFVNVFTVHQPAA